MNLIQIRALVWGLSMGILPIPSMYYFIVMMKNVWAAMIFMHLSLMIGMPLIYIVAIRGRDVPHPLVIRGDQSRFAFYKVVIRKALSLDDFKRKLTLGLQAASLPAVFSWLFYHALRCEPTKASPYCIVPENVRDIMLNCGFDVSAVTLLIGGAYFIFINPLVEEFFWRIFLGQELGAVIFGRPCEMDGSSGFATNFVYGFRAFFVETLQNLDENGNTTAASGSDDDDDSDLTGTSKSTASSTSLTLSRDTKTTKKAAAGRKCKSSYGCVMSWRENDTETRNGWEMSNGGAWFLSILFSLYHGVIIYYFLGTTFAMIGTLNLVLWGRIWMFCRNSKGLGFWIAFWSHLGMDLGAAIILLQALHVSPMFEFRLAR